MPSYTKIFIHAVLTVKDRRKLITPKLEPVLFKKLTEEIESCESKVLSINGVEDHIHILISLSPKISFSELTKRIKGASSHWVNSNDLIKDKFVWQKGPRGFSVSKSNIPAVVAYIKKQKIHHKKVSFEKEYNDILKKHGLVDEA